MMHLWKSLKLFVGRMSTADHLLVKICLCALGVLVGLTVPRNKKLQAGIVASGVFAGTCIPLMNKFFDASDELALSEE